MTVTVPTAVADRQPGPACGICGRSMAADQEWCLECGAARTVIARAPDWRIPVLVVGLVLALIVGGLVFALTSLSGNAGKLNVVTPSAPGAGAGTAHASTPRLASWQPGLDGYTVILATESSQAAADSAANALAARHVAGVGVLSTSQHPQMQPAGVWDVFAGRFPSDTLAEAAAASAARHGQPHARAALVQRAGQG